MSLGKQQSVKRKLLSSTDDDNTADSVTDQSNGESETNLKKNPYSKHMKQDTSAESTAAETKTVPAVKEKEELDEIDCNSAPRIMEAPKENLMLLNKKKELREFASESDSDSDAFDGSNGRLSAFERRRLANIKANANFLAKINMQQARLELGELRRESIKSSTGRKYKKKEVLPVRRRSLRLQKKDPDGELLPDPPQASEPHVDEHPRLAKGPLSAEQLAADETYIDAFDKLKSLPDMDIWTSPEQCDGNYDQLTRSLSELKLNERRVVKVVRNRVFSVAVHPNSQRLIAVAGDKWGQVGFWDVNSECRERDVCAYTPHSRPVSCLQFSPINAGKLYSCSYDGTVRCCHFESAQFQELYRTSEEYEERCIAFDFMSRDQLLVARDDGFVVRVDDREKSSVADKYKVVEKVVKCVSVHPRQQYYFITSDSSGCVRLFDLRKAEKNMKSVHLLTHFRSVNSAYFAPVTGKYILTTVMDDTVNIISSSPANKMTMKHKIRHENHTGRWLTSFRATWHPARDDLFIVGSLSRPRQIDIFNSSGRREHALLDAEYLSTVCSANVFHPTIPAVIGANSSGKLHAFF